MLRSDLVKGDKRTFYSVRLIAMAVGAAMFVSGLVGSGVALWISADSADKVYQQDVRACLRQNQSRRESNRRIPAHEADRDNLRLLARTLAHTRAAEAAVYTALGRKFHIERDVAPLVRALRRALNADVVIARREAKVTFGRLATPSCRSQRVVRHQ